MQFSCLAVDNSGEIVCAGGLDTFEIYVWSMQTGRLLEVMTCFVIFHQKSQFISQVLGAVDISVASK